MLGDGTVFDILDSVKDIPILVVTGAGDQEIAVKAWRAGAYDYLIKDLNHDYLKTIPITIENAIRHATTESKLSLLSAALMSTKECVYITDMQRKIIFVNKAFLASYGYAEAEIVGQDSSIVWVASGQNVKVRGIFETRCSGGGSELAFVHKRKDGRIFPVSLSSSVIKDPKGEPVAIVNVARNITEWVRIEDELRAATQEKQLMVGSRTD
jgi:PAS domain S-box-containing protein